MIWSSLPCPYNLSRFCTKSRPGGPAIYDGQEQFVDDKWAVNRSQKTNLCNWLCENGTVDDFQHFSVIFDLLGDAFGDPYDQTRSSA